jgi:hypothetical protein
LLTQVEQLYVIDRLELLLAPLNGFRSTLVAPLAEDVRRRVPELSPLASFAAEKVLQICMEDVWNHTPPTIVSFLSQLLPVDAQIETICKRLATPPPPEPDPDFSTILATNAPFVNRTQLRQKLKTLSNPAAPKPILVVTGGTRTGKSYTAELVDHFCLKRPNICVSRHRVDPGTGPVTALDVARDILASMGRPFSEPPPQTTNADRWPLELVNWVLVAGAQTNLNWWFVLDGFEGQNLAKDTRAFINFLADRLTTGIYSRTFRLILLGFERGLLTVQPGKIETDQTAQVQEAEIRECVSAIVRRARDPIDPDLFIQRILQDLPTDHTRLEELNRRLCDLIETVEAANALP